MRIRFDTLTLQNRRSIETITFSPRVSFFHGQIGAGKSSIARLLEYCLGGALERTTAISQELVSVSLAAHIGEYDVLLEREAKQSNQVQVTWRNDKDESLSVLAPTQATKDSPSLWGEDVVSLSDLLFALAGVRPIKVRKGKQDPDSPLVRLSFRDLMWYCYLDQDHLDSTLFRLEDPARMHKSRDVMRFVVGYYTEKLNELEQRLEEISTERAGKLEAAAQIRTFLERFGFGSEAEIRREMERAEASLTEAHSRLAVLRDAYAGQTHPADTLRATLRELSGRLGDEQETLADLDARIEEQRSLRAELISAKFKLARTTSATAVLAGVRFEFCPACGTRVHAQTGDVAECYLCQQIPSSENGADDSMGQAELVRQDLTERVTDLEDNLHRHEQARERQARRLERLVADKQMLDRQLSEELRTYDSVFLARSRGAERDTATLEERLRGLERMAQLPQAVVRLLEDAAALQIEEQRIRQEIQDEQSGLTNADRNIEAIEQEFLEALLAIGVPGVSASDTVVINRKTWVPWVRVDGDESLQWSFANAGSGGKKTLFNVCYAMAVHQVASRYDLPLPRFLMIDTPMKNIGEDVNRELFAAFYAYVYGLANGTLADTQIIVIDKEFIAPEGVVLAVLERYMTPTDDAHPPLISYYRGP